MQRKMLLDVSTFGFERVGEISISNGSECNESEGRRHSELRVAALMQSKIETNTNH